MTPHTTPSTCRIIPLFVLALLLAVGAQAATVQVDYDDTADFASYSTFAWKAVGPDHPVAQNPLTDQRIREAIEAELLAKGMKPQGEGGEGAADFELVYHAAIRDETRITDWGRGRRWGRQIAIDTYQSGTLVLDVLDGDTGDLVWRGAISEILPGPKRVEKQFRKGAAKLLRNFPPVD